MPTILLAENDPGFRESVVRCFSLRGLRVLEATCGDEAITITREMRGRFDLLITDVLMPDMNGVELAKTVGHRHPEIPVLFVSVDDVDAKVLLAQRPFEMEDLYLMVLQILTLGVIDPVSRRRN
jgi:two-component system cell cycle sensor histidine kinase/response regulator CckA